MDTSGDQRQASTPLAQPTAAPSEPNSAVSWASAFQSPEFMLGLQTGCVARFTSVQRSNGPSCPIGITRKPDAIGYEFASS